MQSIFDAITQWIKEFLIACITGNLQNMFGEINGKVDTIAANVGQTPGEFNPGVLNMIRNLSDTVIIPIAGIVITFVLAYELISYVIDQNNLHNIDTWIFFKWVFKAGVAVLIVTHTFDIVMAVFDVAQHIVQESAGVINSNASIDIESVLGDVTAMMEAMEIPELFLLMVETWIVKFTVTALSLLISIILFGRMIEIYLYVSVGPLPLSTLANREWGGTGQNYLRGLAALGLQGFFMLVCVAIYAVMVQGIGNSSDIHAAIWECLTYTVVLCFTLFKTGGFAKSICNAH